MKLKFHLLFNSFLKKIGTFVLVLSIVAPLVLLQPPTPVYADKAGVCAIPGKDGPTTTLSGVVNSYYPGTAPVVAGATSIPVGARTGSSSDIAAGDLLLVVQMQGADIDLTNTNNYGNGVGNGGTTINTVTFPTGDPDYAGGNVAANFSAGDYEYVVATGPVAGGYVPISTGLVNAYYFSNNTGGASQGQRRFQVIRVPQYSNATLSATVTALRWDGSTGGIVAFDVAGQLNWNGYTIDVSGLGFRGGGGRQLTGGTGNWWDFRTVAGTGVNVAGFNGAKGEGYAGTPRQVNNNGVLLDNGVEGYPNGSNGRGGAGNGGGGSTDGQPSANDRNSGGGGGGNGGYGGMGGNAWNTGVVDGGYGGAPFPGSAPRLIMGGGGGAGTTNNGTGLPNGFSSSGVAGGGVVMVRSGTITGTGTINANGSRAFMRGDANVVLNDGGGGGGAGGSVVVIARNGSGNVGTLTVSATGGRGGDTWPNQAPGTPGPGAGNNHHGPGGGGGGGFVYTSGAVNGASSVAGGLNGISTTDNSPFGATAGGPGTLVQNVTPEDIPLSISGANCVPVSNLTTIKTTSTPNVVAGNTATYTITVSNVAGEGGASGVVISDTLPSGFTYASTGSVTLSGNAVRSPTTPNPTAPTSTPQWGTFLIPGGGSVAITYNVTVSSSAISGTYQNPATATFLDPVRTTSAGSLTSSYDPLSSTQEDVTVTGSVCTTIIAQWTWNTSPTNPSPATTGTGTFTPNGLTVLAPLYENVGSDQPAIRYTGWDATINTAKNLDFAVSTVGYTGINFQWGAERMDNRAPATAELRYSTDGTNFLSPPSNTYGVVNGTWTDYPVKNLSTITALDNNALARFRIYAYGGTGGTQTSRRLIFDTVTVRGCITTADLLITKTDGVSSVKAGGTTTYTVRATNGGPSSVTGTVLSDPVATGLSKTVVACSGTPGQCVTPPTVAQLESGTFALPALTSGQYYEVTVTATVTATTGTVTNTASVAAPSGVTDPTPGNNSASDVDTVVAIDAVNDTGTTINSATGGTSIANVLVNDTLNGSAATTSNVTITAVGTWPAGVTLNTSTGAVSVASGIAAGIYTPLYQICSQAAPSICDTATVTVPVVAIDAVNDSGLTVNGVNGGQSLANVLANDTLNGLQATLSNVNLTQVSTDNPNVTLNPATGSVNVAAGTSNGTYNVVYRICDKTNPTICDTATVTVPVQAIDAVDDSGATIDRGTGGTSIANVLVNDTLNSAAATTSNVDITTVGSWPSGITLNTSTGAVNVALGTAAGTYTPQYQICDKVNPTICDTAIVTVTVTDLPKNFGHLPVGGTPSYTGMNLLAEGGASHLTGSTYLGAAVRVESDGSNEAVFTRDTAYEDGVASTTGVSWKTGTVASGNGGSVTVTAVCPAPNCYLNAWIDWSNNGVFDEAAGEHIFNNYVLTFSGSHTYTLPFDIPTTLGSSGTPISGVFYSRFRVYASDPGTNNTPNGPALNSAGTTATVGEVEDYVWGVSGGVVTPVTLSFFLAQRQGSKVNFSWSTATETGNVGFNLYVKSGRKLVQINTQLIPSPVIDSLERQDYSFSAKVNGDIFYIEDVSVLGETKQHGPFKIDQSNGAKLTIERINQAAVQAEHDNKYAQRQDELGHQLTIPSEARETAAKPVKPTKVVAPTKTSKPTATIKPTKTPKITATATPIATVEPTATLEPTATTEPTVEPGETLSPSETSESTATLEPTATETPESTATLEPTATEQSTETPEQTATLESTATTEPTATLEPTATPVPYATPIPVDPASLQLTTTFNLKVRQTGIYRVTYEILRDAGLDLAGIPISKITVINRDYMVPVYVYVPDQAENFGPGGFIEFYGEALDTTYTDTNIYTVQVSTATVSRIPINSTALDTSSTPGASFTNTMMVNNQRVLAAYAPGSDAWYDTYMMVYTTPKSWNFSFQVNGLVSSPATLNLVVWGVTDWPQNPDHHLKVSVNGISVADQTFDGLIEKKLEISMPAGVLQEGTNTLQLTLPGDLGVKYDVINLDKFSVTYQRLFQAQNGQLTFNAAGEVFKVDNLPSSDVVVYRLSQAGQARLSPIQVQASGATYSATFAGDLQASTYLISAAGSLYSPVLEAVRQKVDLNRPAQYLIISHPDFINGLQPLVQARQAQGLTVNVVDVTDVYAQYSYGIFDPQAIKRYIAYAANNLGTQYVLLVGGDTYDYRNYLGKNSISFIPSLYVETDLLTKFVPADPLFADINTDGLPDLAIGRFPVRTTAELNLMVTKTLVYAGKDYGHTAVFAADKFDGIVSFKDSNARIIANMPSGWTVENINLDDLTLSLAQQRLIAAMNRGTALVTYSGHSGGPMWSFSNLFTTNNAAALTNFGRPFVVVQWGCWNTYYVDPVNNYLAQKFLFSGNQGAAAVLGAMGRTDSDSERLLGELLTPRLAVPGMTVGQALQDSKQVLAQTRPELVDVLLGWSLLGDPALVIEP